MKNDGSNFYKKLRTETNTVALGWLVTRSDGFQLGFTSWDEEFELYGITFKPSNAFQGSANETKSGLSVDNMEANALLTVEIDDKDLMGGVYDNALVQVFWLDPTAPQDGILPLRGGRFGEIKIKNNTFDVELRSPAQKLQQPYCDLYTLECRVNRLGDSQCKVNMAPTVWAPHKAYAGEVDGDASIGAVVQPSLAGSKFWYKATTAGTSAGTEPVWPTTDGATVTDGGVVWTTFPARIKQGTVTGLFNRAVFSDSARDEPVFYFQYGLLTWLSGENEGLSIEVRSFDGAPVRQFVLMEAMPYPIALGDAYKVSQGCAKTKSACKAFNNIMNFRGFPYMPTEDKALETPNYTSQGEQDDDNDGGVS